MRIVVNRAFYLRAGFLAIFCTLAFAASAYGETSIPSTSPEAVPSSGQEAAGAPAGEPTGSGAERTPPEGATGGPAPEPKPEGSGAGQGTGGSPEGAGTGTGEHPEPPPVAKEPLPPVQEPPPAVTGEGTPATAGPGAEPTHEPTPVATEQGANVPGVVMTKVGEEETPASSTSGSHAVVSPDAGTSPAAVARAEASGEAAQGPPVAIAGGLTPPPTGPTGPTADGLQAQASAPAAGGGSSGGGSHAVIVTQSAGSLSCELTALGGRTMENCTVGWLGGKRLLSSNAGVTPVADALAAAASSAGLSPPDGGHGGSAVGNSPVSPGPGPAPSGASGAAVGGASGAAPSAFLSLAGLLLLAAPRALRRLRLSCRPWLTACFVLIPERPG